MSTLILVVCLSILEVMVSMSTADPGLNIKTNPSEINLGITSSLDINCTFSLKDHPDMAAFVSLILARANSSGQNFEELAAITQFTPDTPTLMTQEKAVATGVHSQTGESFLNMRWEFPTVLQAGVYQCSAHGMDMYGHPLVVTNISTVTVDEANLNDIFQKLKEMEIRQSSMQDKISAMETSMSDMQHNMSALQNNMSAMQSERSAMESYIHTLEFNFTQMSSHISVLENSVCASRHMNFTGTYGNQDYFVSKEPFADINTAMDTCKSYGGQLAEISDENEFRAVQGFLNHISGFNQVVIAGSDAASEGHWTFQSNNMTSPYIVWRSDQPNGGDNSDCLDFCNIPSTTLMCDLPCHINSPTTGIRFMCEIPYIYN